MKTEKKNTSAHSRVEPVIRVVHADDHELFRGGLRSLFEGRSDIRLVASVSGEALLETLKSKPSDLLLIDLSMPGADGLSLIEKVRAAHPSIKVIALTMHKDREYFKTAIARGAHGYLLKDDVFETLIVAIRAVYAGEKYYSAAVQALVIQEFEIKQDAASSIHLLSAKEQDILKLIALGQMNKDIAAKMRLSVRTVESHRANIMRKLKINNVQGLTRFALDHEMI